ncbi:hypothetical protein ILUMI_25969 [Ignelater luminosus]|uniref:PiggyBac transposable element-derived protein domain-containing protein n=1 Tax=Ignelater luminosus TaxID=2038154 RepID=A0A8K0C8W1_IGNLU|nr:hypothetical protein ILUMI_25969 [Ignelater luminosus]
MSTLVKHCNSFVLLPTASMPDAAQEATNKSTSKYFPRKCSPEETKEFITRCWKIKREQPFQQSAYQHLQLQFTSQSESARRLLGFATTMSNSYKKALRLKEIEEILKDNSFYDDLENSNNIDTVIIPPDIDELSDEQFHDNVGRNDAPSVDVVVFQQFGVFDKNFAVDEMMIRYFGRDNLKQFIRGKYKLWALCGQSGYCYNLNLYTGHNQVDEMN